MNPPAATAKPPLHYGWIVVAVTFLTQLTTAGAMSAPSVLLEPLQREFGWSTATISVSLSVRMAVFGLIAPFAAALMLRFGLRAIMATSAVIVALGMLASAAVTDPWQLTVLWGLVVGGGTGMTALVLGATVANRWFVNRRGLVIGIMTASSATGQLLFLPLYAVIDQSFGWQSVLVAVAAAMLLLVPLIVWLMRDHPADVGLAPYGAIGSPAPPPPQKNPVAATFEAAGVAVRSRDFWLLSSGFFVCGLSTSGLIGAHLVAACSDHGISQVSSAGLLALMGGFDLVGTVASGWLSDRWNNQRLLCIYYCLRGLSLVFLPMAIGNSFLALTVFAAFYGLDWFATLPPTIRMTTATFGKTLGPLVFGWMFVAHQLGAAVATFAAGLTRTVEGTYAPAFVVSGLLCVVAGVLCLFIGRKPALDETRFETVSVNV
ncbi:MFS transporter [Mesorhizobium sp. VK23B]|uniref:MFS transporter n=1 Tax=Mesorhizobium dulcispinae TaxID=3072316 RepID=A0ABU4XPJ9_9HYPH|nr:MULTISPECIES: MFS transporter [unclassified Mesorhizobium]MDX8470279.1 MFS transporter [Mesorhizobium sp. VK23B]MDX8476666.1 MFS transporter [Mesorhizobium sp. VK23A]